MATYTQTLPVNQTLSGTTADIINVSAPCPQWVKVVNRDPTNTLWVKQTGAAPVAADQTAAPILPLKELSVYVGAQVVNVDSIPRLQVVGNGGGYSIFGGVQ